MRNHLRVAGLVLTAACFTPLAPAAWAVDATHSEAEAIGVAADARFDSLSSFCLDSAGNLVAADSGARLIRTLSTEGKPIKNWKLDFAPSCVRADDDSTFYVGGEGRVVKLDKDGKTLVTFKSDGKNFPSGRVSGIAVLDKHVFVAAASGWNYRTGGIIVRFDRDLAQPKEIVSGLRCCCGRLDLAAAAGTLYAAENARHCVNRYDSDGKALGAFGKSDRNDLESFGGCCNPMNIALGPGGDVYTAESGPDRVKRFSSDGKFLGLVGDIGTVHLTREGRQLGACTPSTIAVSKDGKAVYVQDASNNLIRVLKAK